MLEPDNGPGTTSRIQNAVLVASHKRQAIIGGLPADAPAGARPAPIVIEDSIVDRRLRLEDNVTLGKKVTFAHLP